MKPRRKTVREEYNFNLFGHRIRVIKYKLGEDFHPRYRSYVTIDHSEYKYVPEDEVDKICLYLMREGFIPKKFDIFLWDEDIKFWEMYRSEYDEAWENDCDK